MRDLIALIEKAEGSPEILEHLRQKYHEFNNAYFHGDLPEIPIRWGSLKNAGAHVGFVVVTKGGTKTLKPDTMEMVISAKYQRTAEELEPILLHEMVHVYVAAILHNVTDHHGPVFMEVLRDLQARSGIDIPLTDNTRGLELADSTIKPYAVILQSYASGNGGPSYAILSPNTVTTKLDAIKDRFKDGSYRQIELRLVRSQLWTEKAARTPIQRNVDHKLKFYTAKPDDLTDLLAHSELIWTNH